MDYLLKLFPPGWFIEPGMKLFLIIKIVAKHLKELQDWIQELHYIIPQVDHQILDHWESMTKIDNIETGSDRITNIKNKLVGEYGLFNETLIKKIIELYSKETADFEVYNSQPLRAGKSLSGERVISGNGIFEVFLKIKNSVTDKDKLTATLQKIKHTHINLFITYA